MIEQPLISNNQWGNSVALYNDVVLIGAEDCTDGAALLHGEENGEENGTGMFIDGGSGAIAASVC